MNSLSQIDGLTKLASPISFDKVRMDVKERADQLAKQEFTKRNMEREDPTRNYKYTKIDLSPPFPEPKEFTSNDYPYVLTTEVNQLHVLQELRTIFPQKEGLFLGFAFEFNYHLLAERPVKFAWICDINKKMHTLYTFIQTTILTSPNRAAFISAFRKEISQNHDYYFGCLTGFEDKVIDHYLKEEFSWLYSDEKFLRIKNLYANKKICHAHLDLVEDSYFFGKLKEWADSNQLQFDVIYLSNIPEWLQRTSFESVTKMKTNLLQILSPQTLLIDAKQPSFERGDPTLRLTKNITHAKAFPSFTPPKQISRIN